MVTPAFSPTKNANPGVAEIGVRLRFLLVAGGGFEPPTFGL